MFSLITRAVKAHPAGTPAHWILISRSSASDPFSKKLKDLIILVKDWLDEDIPKVVFFYDPWLDPRQYEDRN